MRIMLSTSSMGGQFLITTSPSVRTEAAKRGRTAFFADSASVFPSSLIPPLMMYFAIICTAFYTT